MRNKTLHKPMNITQETETFEILLVTSNKTLFKNFYSYLAGIGTSYTLFMTKDLSELTPLQSTLRDCEVILFDLDGGMELLTIASKALQYSSAHTFIAGLTHSTHAIKQLSTLDTFLQISNIIDLGAGWDSAWPVIAEMWGIYQNPAMISCIEDVSVSDVLQMIGVGGFTSIVNIQGTMHPDDEQRHSTIRGSICFNKGIPKMAWSTHATGVQAIFELLTLSVGHLFVIHPVFIPIVKNLQCMMQEILLSYSVAMDETEAGINGNVTVLDTIENGSSTKNEADTKETDVVKLPACPGVSAWWHTHGKTLGSLIENIEMNSFPLRWMREHELEKLITSTNNTECIVALGCQDTLKDILQVSARNYIAPISDKTEIPVLRLGRIKGTGVYLCSLSTPVAIPLLTSVPVILCLSDTFPLEKGIQLIHHTTPVVFIIDQSATKVAILSDNKEYADTIFITIPTATNDRKKNSVLFGKIAAFLGTMAPGGDTHDSS